MDQTKILTAADSGETCRQVLAERSWPAQIHLPNIRGFHIGGNVDVFL